MLSRYRSRYGSTCKTAFRAAIPRGPINDDTGTQDNSIIPELIIVTKSISADMSALGGGGRSY
jgi:hypothetical protein